MLAKLAFWFFLFLIIAMVLYVALPNTFSLIEKIVSKINNLISELSKAI